MYRFDFSNEKDLILRETRGIGFREVIKAAQQGRILNDLEDANQEEYPDQRLLIVEINGYAYVAPYVFNAKQKVSFLKTVYPSRKATKRYLNKEDHE